MRHLALPSTSYSVLLLGRPLSFPLKLWLAPFVVQLPGGHALACQAMLGLFLLLLTQL